MTLDATSGTFTIAPDAEEAVYLAGWHTTSLDLDGMSVDSGGALMAHLFPAGPQGGPNTPPSRSPSSCYPGHRAVPNA